jgi:alkaline phosphatase
MKLLNALALISVLSFGVTYSQDVYSPKNIIILIGDGMGINYVSAAILSLDDHPFKEFTTTGFSITCSADKLITDSAAGATAISTGYRTKNHYVGVDTLGNPKLNLFEIAEQLGYSTGIVVTSTVTHATPASFIAHIISRKEETEIASQFTMHDIDVVIGGGSKYFSETDSISHLSFFDKLKDQGYDFFVNADELFSSEPEKKFYALLEEGALNKAAERDYSLADLTSKAINLLSKNDNGFILLIEGSQIDWGGHDNDQPYIISELNDFCGAISASINFAKEDGNTLVLVTADHETGGMSINEGKPGGAEMRLNFTTKGHTAEMVGIFTMGPGEYLFQGILDNYMIGRKLIQLLNPEFSF